ncbi:alkaline phosphatase family protein [Microbacterium sp. zg.B48]|uniref:alkaline phosphatase family protein n=1 Tax=unclassified Microbacterium TaxID=2609290 RepID=UPI00214C0576|nr:MULTISPECIES: nucleotide pyrophosphatase/phosphodiesterase family protein [unclassified Microbacterium]MCR2761943.1 alkaline phosphatase family protein [Microbacterium sp. zg.B48]MCR2811099.1 alkaline phosphatase family protein [Microbacterium sp. zg.B185]WIM20785.1 alkaline phosphatase family protein [Microbacterium sp. zg-B185]
MSLSLPAEPRRARSLTGVAPQMIAALDGTSDWFAPARSVIVFVIDGLGAANLGARAGHARFLSSAASKKDVARTVFPSTTASALTSLLTGVRPGEHGIVGYRVLDPDSDHVLNQLRGWDTDGLDIAWQRAEPLTERHAAGGRPSFIVSKGEYAGTGFTTAIMRGAQFVAVEDLAERTRTAADLAARNPGAFVYVYAPDLDAIGHKRGWQSDEWVAALERVDAASRILSDALAPGTGAVITADHGMVDVPRHRHVLLTDDDDLLDGVRHIGGEPRMLHLYAEPGMSEDLLGRWTESESDRSWVLSRSQAVDAGLFGPVSTDVLPRIGDVLVAARAGIAYYDDRLEDKGAQRMVGQHGSLTDEERTVPLIRLGAFA